MKHATEQYHLYTCMVTVVYKHMQIHTFIQSNIFVKILTLDILLFIRVFSARGWDCVKACTGPAKRTDRSGVLPGSVWGAGLHRQSIATAT